MTAPQLMHFVVRNITYTPTVTGYLITCYTNYPCHLYLRWTTIEPAKHIIPRLVRGGQVGTYIDQCFVAFTDIEQNEAGDTYTHSFIVDPWLYCQTRWFYFWGTVGGELSPSASALFYYHSTAMAIYCYNEAANIGHYSAPRCTCFSFAFKPQSSYTIRHWKTHLRRAGASDPQNTFEIWIFTATDTGKPITKIGYGFKTGIVLPPLPNWLDIDFPISPAPVIAGGQYAILWRLTTDFKLSHAKALEQDSGLNDICYWKPPPDNGYYYCSPDFQPDETCNPPPGIKPILPHAGGGRQYYESYGTPT